MKRMKFMNKMIVGFQTLVLLLTTALCVVAQSPSPKPEPTKSTPSGSTTPGAGEG